jgi:hypothetical protein
MIYPRGSVYGQKLFMPINTIAGQFYLLTSNQVR